MKKNTLRVIPLGGLGEIGKNITAIEYEDEIIVIDCGVSFPDDDMLGIDLVIPDITYLLDNKEKVKGLFITHGHEDHIGSIPYILKQLNMDIYATRLTIGLIESKLEEHKIDKRNLIPVKAGDVIRFNKLSVEFIRATHSIADACSLAIFTPLGTIVHTGDFKIDYTPIDGRVMDLNRFSALGEEGILLLMADSTNVERSGHSLSEKTIGETLNRIIRGATGRVIVATFASNIHRMQQVVDASLTQNRKICFSGRSMENVSKVAMELGYLHIPDDAVINVDELNNYDDNITIITTGSQGEPMAGLSRIAYGNHRKIKLQENDLFIISASPIPGNELKLIHSITKPKYFLPVHGEYRHLKHHADLAKKMGMSGNNIFTMETGDVLEITEDGARVATKVRTGVLYVDGIGVGDVGNIVLRDRRNLARDGMVIIVFAIDSENLYLASGPDVITRGFIYARESEEIINEIKEVSRQKIEECLEDETIGWQVLKGSVRKAVETLLFEKTKRRPSVFPIIMEI